MLYTGATAAAAAAPADDNTAEVAPVPALAFMGFMALPADARMNAYTMTCSG